MQLLPNELQYIKKRKGRCAIPLIFYGESRTCLNKLEIRMYWTIFNAHTHADSEFI